MLGKWIDGLTDEQRDRIIEHPDPTFNGSLWWSPTRDCGCLVGAVLGRDTLLILCNALETAPDWAKVWSEIGARFPALTVRFGPARVWRACKLRASRRNSVLLPAPLNCAVREPELVG